MGYISYQQGVSLNGVMFPSDLQGCYDLSNFIAVNVLPCVNAGLSSQPNPTNGPSMVTFTLPETGHASIEVYDLNGRLVHSLFSAVAEAELDYRFEFDGSRLPNGIYLYRLTTDKEVLIDKFMIAR